MRLCCLLILTVLLAFPLHAAPSIGIVRATPITAVVGTPTQITVEASISDPSLIANSINLLELNANGTISILGTLHDDGLNGDLFAGDKIFTILVTLNQTSTSAIELQVSAAFKGSLQRVKSPVVKVFFQPANAPQQSINTLAQYLKVGNITLALNYVVPSNKTVTTLNSLNQQGLSALAGMLTAGVLVNSQPDLRTFQAPFQTPNGVTTVEFSMVPGPNGVWLINSW